MHIIQNRRTFLAGLAAAGAAGLIGAPSSARAEPPPETTTVRLPRYFDDDGGCWAALYIAGELLSAEGFTDVQYVQGDLSVDNSMWLAGGETDFDLTMASMHDVVGRCRRADHGADRPAHGVLRSDRQRQHPQLDGSAGQEGGRCMP